MTIPDNEPTSGFRVHSQFTLALNQYFKGHPYGATVLAEVVKTLEISGVLFSEESLGNLAVSLPAFLQIVAKINDPKFLDILTSYSSFACLRTTPIVVEDQPTPVADSHILNDLDLDFM